MPQKIKGVPICQYKELKIYATEQKPKTQKGKCRICIGIRQNKPKQWKIDRSLTYVHGADICFVEETPGKTEKQGEK